MPQRTPLEFLTELRDKIMKENVSRLAMGAMLFDEYGIRITEDAEDEYIPSGQSLTLIETEYAQELSWEVRQFKDGLFDVISYFDKQVFYSRLADAATSCIARTSDRAALLLSVLEEATLITVQAQVFKNQDMRDEVLACVASLSDVAEKA